MRKAGYELCLSSEKFKHRAINSLSVFTDSQGWKRNLCAGAGLKALFTTPGPSLCPCEILCVETSWRVYGSSGQPSVPGLKGRQVWRTGMMKHSKRGAQSLLALAWVRLPSQQSPCRRLLQIYLGPCSTLLLLAEVKESSEISGHKASAYVPGPASPIPNTYNNQTKTPALQPQRGEEVQMLSTLEMATPTHAVLPALGGCCGVGGKH